MGNIIRKRIGKTLNINWAILIDGEPTDLTHVSLSVKRVYIAGINRPELVDITKDVHITSGAEGIRNVVSFTWQGNSQTKCGRYGFIAIVNEGKENQSVVDSKDIIELVLHVRFEKTPTASEEDIRKGIEVTDNISLSSDNIELGQSDYWVDYTDDARSIAKHGRGTYRKYFDNIVLPEGKDHHLLKSLIYFATDQQTIYLDNEPYSGRNVEPKIIEAKNVIMSEDYEKNSVEGILGKLIKFPEPTLPELKISTPDADASVEYGEYLPSMIRADLKRNDSGGIVTEAGINQMIISQDGVPSRQTEVITWSNDYAIGMPNNYQVKKDTTLQAKIAYRGNIVEVQDELGLGITKMNEIDAGVLATTRTWTPYRKMFYCENMSVAEGGQMEQIYAALDALTGDRIRSFWQHVEQPSGKFRMTGHRYGKKLICFAIPSNRSVKSILNTSTMGLDETSVWKHDRTIIIEGANGSEAIEYNIWYYYNRTGFMVDEINYEINIV